MESTSCHVDGENNMGSEGNERDCPTCGAKLLGDSIFCSECGTKIDDQSIAFADTKEINQNRTNPKRKKIVITVVCIIVAILIIFFIVIGVQASSLKKQLAKDWTDISGDNGSYIVRILDFSDNEIEYRLETGYAWMDTTVATYKYKVISGDKIKVLRFGDKYETFSLKFNDDKTMMIVKPSLTSVDDEETWFYLE